MYLMTVGIQSAEDFWIDTSYMARCLRLVFQRCVLVNHLEPQVYLQVEAEWVAG